VHELYYTFVNIDIFVTDFPGFCGNDLENCSFC